MKTNRKIMYGFLLVILSLFMLSVAFALSDTGKAVEISPSKTVISPNTCPQYVAPSPDFCKGGKVIAGAIDENGCIGHPRCIPPNTTVCQAYAGIPPELCKNGEIVEGIVGDNGCRGPPRCVLPTKDIVCQDYSSLPPDFCKNGEIVEGVIGDNGCLGPPICVLKACHGSECDLTKVSNPNCRKYSTPSLEWCKNGKIVEGTIDANGCQTPLKCSLPTKDGETVEITLNTSRGSTAASAHKISEKIISIKDGTTSVTTSNKMIIEEKNLLMETSNGTTKEIKIMPSTASDVAINQLKLKNYTIELKDVGKPVYEINGKKDVKFLGFISAKMMVTSQVDADTGVVENTRNAWWSFLAKK